ncbi:MAG: 2,3-diphosphoglycerate synthetase [Actinomycetota bacterium]
MVVVVDGEHYPPVVEGALEAYAAMGHELLGAVMAGGTEKLGAGGLSRLGGLEVRSAEDPRIALAGAIAELRPDAVLDLSDEPVLDYRRRHELAAVALWHDVGYEGADFSFRPPPRPRLATKPSIAIIGTGKRTGKTAVAGYAARTLAAHGHRPVVVAMGRGGPEHPEVLRGDEIELTPSDLLELAEAGRHAASDYIEDALLARVATVGCRRCGGGLAGGVEITNVPAGVALANELDGEVMLLEGSGAAIPPARADVTGLVVPAHVPHEYLAGYMGPYRLLLADFVVVTMCENPFGSPSQISSLTSLIGRAFRATGSAGSSREELRVVRTVFRPTPVASIEGAEVFVATTAPESAGQAITEHLEGEHHATVVGISHSLSDRKRLQAELEELRGRADVLLCEIKAAAIDVATRQALAGGLKVVYMDNVPVGIDGDDPQDVIEWAAALATARFGEQSGEA